MQQFVDGINQIGPSTYRLYSKERPLKSTQGRKRMRRWTMTDVAMHCLEGTILPKTGF